MAGKTVAQKREAERDADKRPIEAPMNQKKGCFCNEGWICEQHPEQGWPHDDCPGHWDAVPVLQP